MRITNKQTNTSAKRNVFRKGVKSSKAFGSICVRSTALKNKQDSPTKRRDEYVKTNRINRRYYLPEKVLDNLKIDKYIPTKLEIDGLPYILLSQEMYDRLFEAYVLKRLVDDNHVLPTERKIDDVKNLKNKIYEEAVRRLKLMRINVGLTQTALADLIGKKPQYVSAVERGKARFGRKYIALVEEACLKKKGDP